MPRTFARALGVVAAISLLSLTGCAGAAVPEETTENVVESAPADVAAGYFFESGELPEKPERIVALWRTGSSLAELGVVATGQLTGEYAQGELSAKVWDLVKDIPTVGSWDGINIEDVIAADPDLIIGMDHGGLDIDYSEIAELYPVRILKIAEPTDVWRNYGAIASLVGKSADFDTQLAALDARLEKINGEFGDELGSALATAVGLTEGSVWVDTSKALSYERLSAAGFGYNPDYTDNPERYVSELTLENLPSLAGQDLIFYDAELDGSVSAEVQTLLDEPAFRELPAVKAGHLYPLRGATVYNFEAANLMVDDILAAAKAYTER